MTSAEKLELARAALSLSELEAVAAAILEKNYPGEDWRLWRRCSQGHLGQWYYRKADANGFKRTRCRGCDLARLERKTMEGEHRERPAPVPPAEAALVPPGNLMALIPARSRSVIARALFGIRPEQKTRPSV